MINNELRKYTARDFKKLCRHAGQQAGFQLYRLSPNRLIPSLSCLRLSPDYYLHHQLFSEAHLLI